MWSSRTFSGSPGGFTLAELLVALAILSIAALGLVGAQLYSMKAGGGSRMRHTASTIAYRIMVETEDTLRKDFLTSVTTAKTGVPGQEGFQYQVHDALEGGATDLKKITVTVYWEEEGAEREYSVFTYIYKYN
ncbi:MAG: prepilin-type N-terminal cleavage/methylation domain-containing protein [Candidatus Eremiobacteraeota bacterium]|nr:prepilin-type N-terminal cleavage/methylation domain-containing protein [Candidatus Eremiobacteraeota bacterium]